MSNKNSLIKDILKLDSSYNKKELQNWQYRDLEDYLAELQYEVKYRCARS